MNLRPIGVVIASILLAAQVVRNGAVEGLALDRPDEAARVWPDHPSVEIELAMTNIARAARSRHSAPPAAFSMIDDASTKAPLAPEPFSVRGVQAELAGDDAAAQRAFEAAQWRDPRSLAAAYFLADRYLRIGDAKRGLAQVAALARLSPNGNLVVAPFLANYARNPAGWPALRTMFRENPGLAEAALTTLAANPATAPAVIALADPREQAQDAHWLSPLLNTLVGTGQYEEARAIWGRATHHNEPVLIYDASFNDSASPPPFNWSLTSSTVGVAERRGGRLRILFYGQEDGILARQLLLLQPGQYRLSMELIGDPARAHFLTWSIWCDKSDLPIASASLDLVASRGWTFKVPSDCPAQSLRLSGISADIPQQVDLSVGSLKLVRTGPSA